MVTQVGLWDARVQVFKWYIHRAHNRDAGAPRRPRYIPC